MSIGQWASYGTLKGGWKIHYDRKVDRKSGNMEIEEGGKLRRKRKIKREKKREKERKREKKRKKSQDF